MNAPITPTAAHTGGPTLEGFGTTEEQARERLEKELRDFNDSLWA